MLLMEVYVPIIGLEDKSRASATTTERKPKSGFNNYYTTFDELTVDVPFHGCNMSLSL